LSLELDSCVSHKYFFFQNVLCYVLLRLVLLLLLRWHMKQVCMPVWRASKVSVNVNLTFR
jgi:hypothetical protein